MSRFALAISLFTALLCNAGAVDPLVAFEQANRLYEQAKYAEAAAAYEQLRTNGSSSAALLFNLGNSRFKAGQTGLAIAAYLEAERISPRDPDLRANLRFARETANARGGEAWWRGALRTLTLNEWTLLAVLALWLWLALLALGKLRPPCARSLVMPRRLALAALVLFTGTLLAAAFDRLGARVAVIVVKEAVARFGPLEESQSHYTLRDGAEVRLLDASQDWVQIADASQRIGWVKRVQLQPVGF